MKKIYCCILIGFLLLMNQLVSAQDTVRVVMKVHVGKESVKLRWAVEKPHLWQKMNSKGFIIERFTDRNDGKTVLHKEKKRLTAEPLKAAPLDEWEALASKNPYAAVIAQAIYGDSFETTGMESDGIAQIINLSQEAEQRYTFALYAADLCFEAACLAGWGYEDKEVKEGDCYLYRIIPVDLDSIPSQYGFEYVCMDEHHELPAPVNFRADFGDRFVSLTWEANLLNAYFSAYQIEKSTDNSHFEPLPMPVTSLEENVWGQSVYVDSLPENDRMYYYRLRGISPFGEIGIPSEVAEGKGQSSLKFFPKITRSIINTSGQAEIDWEFDAEGENFIQSFALKRSLNDSGKEEIVVGGINKQQRQVITDQLLSSNYFSIAAERSDGTSWQSYPILLMPLDSVPPVAPTGLTASIDTVGIVLLQWDENPEQDLLGYKVFRAYRDGDEPVATHPSPIEQILWTDTVDLHNLNEFIYYRVVAFDQRYNQSSPSALLKVEKPLKIKPSPPVFRDFHSLPAGIYLEWINNPDEWIAKHTLYRQEKDSATVRKVSEFAGREMTSFTDSLVVGKVAYIYTLTATSKWGVESNPSPFLPAVASAKEAILVISHLKGLSSKNNKGVDISWKTIELSRVESIRIYRSEGIQPVGLWKVVPADTTTVTDTAVKVGLQYNYLVIAIMKDGSFSEKTETSITY